MSIDYHNCERFVLRENSVNTTHVMHQIKSENTGEESCFVDNLEKYQTANDNLSLKVENGCFEQSFSSKIGERDSSNNDSFSLKIDSFSSHFTDEIKEESFVLKSESSGKVVSSPKPLKNAINPQYLHNYGQVINIRESDPFDSCLKGIDRSEFEYHHNSFLSSDIPKENVIHSRIIPTFQRFKDLKVVKVEMKMLNESKRGHPNSVPMAVHEKNVTLKETNKIKRSKLSKTDKKRKQYTCEVCSAEYAYEMRFINHISKHTANFQCKFCPNSYSTRRSLSSHMRVHSKRHL